MPDAFIVRLKLKSPNDSDEFQQQTIDKENALLTKLRRRFHFCF